MTSKSIDPLGACRAGIVCLSVVLATIGSAPVAQATAPAAAPEAAVQPGNVLRFDALTDSLIARLLLGDLVAASKFGTGRPIDDPQRERELLATVRSEATVLGIDADAAVAVFTDQISASKIVQRGLFARWTEHPDEAPTARPDLGQIRAELDKLTHAILAELKTTETLRHGDSRCRPELFLAKAVGAIEHRLDALHRQALRTAVATVCLPE
ncbi:gamma subclass chorismate mutase AroQ [Amycolatopsis pittospori]|uniref:gamma subclass chorismate mutase AroQ n=1 Tax=Amycolatopsis pittospori TaxID=2749434 RepID=UPI0015F095C3|nr:gamma subclass chorismate mutase AroQ [Amycolatopsis pittospori]